jgi:hypothetical protein
MALAFQALDHGIEAVREGGPLMGIDVNTERCIKWLGTTDVTLRDILRHVEW